MPTTAWGARKSGDASGTALIREFDRKRHSHCAIFLLSSKKYIRAVGKNWHTVYPRSHGQDSIQNINNHVLIKKFRCLSQSMGECLIGLLIKLILHTHPHISLSSSLLGG